MNLRLRDHFLYWFHRSLAFTGKIQADSLEQIRRDGFKNILIVATTAIGDAILCTPLISSLRAANPNAKLGFWVSQAAAPLFKGERQINILIPYYGKYRRLKETLHLLKKESFDLALVANANDPDIIPLIWWSGCKRIIRRPQRHTIYSFMIANPEMLDRNHTTGHAIERNLQFCDLIGIPRSAIQTHLEIEKKSENSISDFMGNNQESWWMIHPGASRSKKQWGSENYALLARRILERDSGILILSGSLAEKEICDEIQRRVGMGHRIRNFAGKLRLDELAAFFKKAKLLISGDTGPYHIAMAVGTPTLTLFAPWDEGSSPQINGPYFNLERHRIIATQNMGDPISSISVDQVFKSCQDLLEKNLSLKL